MARTIVIAINTSTQGDVFLLRDLCVLGGESPLGVRRKRERSEMLARIVLGIPSHV